jgi:hypothetical protein
MTFDPAININDPIDLNPSIDHPYCTRSLFKFLTHLNESPGHLIQDKTVIQRLIYCVNYGYAEPTDLNDYKSFTTVNGFNGIIQVLLTKKGMRYLLSFKKFTELWKNHVFDHDDRFVF